MHTSPVEEIQVYAQYFNGISITKKPLCNGFLLTYNERFLGCIVLWNKHLKSTNRKGFLKNTKQRERCLNEPRGLHNSLIFLQGGSCSPNSLSLDEVVISWATYCWMNDVWKSCSGSWNRWKTSSVDSKQLCNNEESTLLTSIRCWLLSLLHSSCHSRLNISSIVCGSFGATDEIYT